MLIQYCLQKLCDILANLHVHFLRAISQATRDSKALMIFTDGWQST